MNTSSDAVAPKVQFLQRPWVQDILPFITSLSIHAAIIVVAVSVVVGGRQIYRDNAALEIQIVPSDASLVESGPAGGVQNVGLGDPTHPPAQDEFPEAGTGWAARPGEGHAAPSLEGGGDGDSADPVIGFSPAGGGIGIGTSIGSGTGDARGPGTGTGRGPLAPFGTPGGGFMTIRQPTGGVSSIVYVCDASGSMINTFASLKEQLVRSIQGLKGIQSFNVVFFQDERCSAMNAGLIFATPENKRKAFKWLDEQTTTGTTNPIPGIELAFKARPQLIYLLTDADFPENSAVRNAVQRLNTGKQTRINTIIFVPGGSDDEASASFKELMKEIAKDNGGVYAHVKESDLK